MSDESIVTLITSPNFAVGAMIESNQDSAGLLQPQVGNPNTLMLNDLPASAANGLSSKQLVVTSGFKDPNDPAIKSAYPPGIPIGTVTERRTPRTAC